MRRKPLPNADAIEARACELCADGESVKEIRAAIKREFEASVTYEEISVWTQAIREMRRESGSLTTMILILFPDGYEFLPAAKRPFATIARPFDDAEPWAVHRSPVMSGERRYTFTTGAGAKVCIWAPSLKAWIEEMRRRGYRLKPVDPDELHVEQAEMFSGKVAA